MSYGGFPYAGVGYAGSDPGQIPQDDSQPTLAVEVAFTTDALDANPAWVDITGDVRSWDTRRGRSRELERFQPGRATVVLSNLDRQYDSVNAAGPWYGYLKPMRRIRIRETFNGVTYPTFDGYVDRWRLGYPANGKDSTATVTATDASKILARTDLPPSVYQNTVQADAPAIWWRFDDPQYQFSAVDSSGNGRTGTPEGQVRFGGESLIVNDPGSSIELEEAANTNVEVAYSLNAASSFAFEFWFKWDRSPASSAFLVQLLSGGSASVTFQVNPATAKGGFVHTNDAGTSRSAQPNYVFVVGRRYHIVCTHDSDRVLRVFIDGAESAYDVQETTSGATTITTVAVGSSNASLANRALVDEFALYTPALSSSRIAAHTAAGTAPWSGDSPATRLGRILDLASWPSALRELDAGNVPLQSAELNRQTVYEHAQKVADTEFGSLFMNRTGAVRFDDRASRFAREPGPEVFGDGVGEVGYRLIEVSDGDEVIRNSATVSRYNGVARTDENVGSVSEFGRFDIVLDGLLHASDQHSADYADFLVAEYAEPRRRVESLVLGPSSDAAVIEQMLARELGDAITVRHRPPGGGDPFEQTCVIEGIEASGAPGGRRQTMFSVSPELEAHVGTWQDWTPTWTNLTVGNGTLVARYVRIGQVIHYRLRLTFGSTTTVDGTAPEFTFPVAPAASYVSNDSIGWGKLDDASGNDWRAQVWMRTTGFKVVASSSNTYVDITSTSPFTWTTSDIIIVAGTYEAAF